MAAHRLIPLVAGMVALALIAGLANADDELRDAFRHNQWPTYSTTQKLSLVERGMLSADPRVRQNAMAGVAHLVIEAPEFARSSIEPRTVRELFYDDDAQVVVTAIASYLYLVNDQEDFERAVVERARAGGGPLTTGRYASLLAQFTSDVAAEWLMSVAENDPDEEARFTAMSMMATSMSSLPQTLLPMLMEAIRSHDYFCHQNLTQGLPKFGLPATAYLPELHNLRSTLEHELSLPEQDRSVRITGPSSVLAHIDRAIAELERMAR